MSRYCVSGSVLTPTLDDLTESHNGPVTRAVIGHLRLTLTKAAHSWAVEPAGLTEPVPLTIVLPCPLWK